MGVKLNFSLASMSHEEEGKTLKKGRRRCLGEARQSQRDVVVGDRKQERSSLPEDFEEYTLSFVV